MEIVTDMGAHGAYIWPAYGAFTVIFVGLYWWAASSNAKARKKLEEMERKNDCRGEEVLQL